MPTKKSPTGEKDPSRSKRQKNLKHQQGKIHPNNHENYIIVGSALLALSAIVVLSIFYPVIRAELEYLFSGKKNVKVIGKSEASIPVLGSGSKLSIVNPIDENFGIVIPKIGVNSRVIPDVDPENEPAYQKALAQGVAHALGTKYPGQEGNVFIFAHSGQDLLEANRFNAVFYLLSKLEGGDEIYIFHKNKKFRYLVTEKKFAKPEEVSYLLDTPQKNTLTLMTCWPAGTNWNRLIVRAEQN